MPFNFSEGQISQNTVGVSRPAQSRLGTATCGPSTRVSGMGATQSGRPNSAQPVPLQVVRKGPCSFAGFASPTVRSVRVCAGRYDTRCVCTQSGPFWAAARAITCDHPLCIPQLKLSSIFFLNDSHVPSGSYQDSITREGQELILHYGGSCLQSL